MLKGSLDAIHNGRCYGWAADDASAAPVEVMVLVDERLAGIATADLYRPDLESADTRAGRIGFCVELPDAVRDSRHHRVELRAMSTRLIAAREGLQVLPRLTAREFDRHAPWIDAPDDAFEQHLAGLKATGKLDAENEARLRFFREHGFLILEQAVPHGLIDKVLWDIESAWRDLPPLQVLNRGLQAPVFMREISQGPEFRNTSFRYLDFHNVSQACAEIMMLPAVLNFVRLCFESDVAAMQTLVFENGTQQRGHQDFAYVHSLRPACLMGAWVSLEDVHAHAGPLFYWDKSHRCVPKHVFADGSVLAEGHGPHVRAFEDYLETACRDHELERLIFTPRKGDVLIWHSALVHGGMPRSDPALTRRSMVSHYTTQDAYPYDRRYPDEQPVVWRKNGGIYYGFRHDEHVEGRYAYPA